MCRVGSVLIAREPIRAVVQEHQSPCRLPSSFRRKRAVRRATGAVRSGNGGQLPLSQSNEGAVHRPTRMSTVTGPVLLSEIASLATRAHDRAGFRTGTLALIAASHPLRRRPVPEFRHRHRRRASQPRACHHSPNVCSPAGQSRCGASCRRSAPLRSGGGGVLDASGLVGSDSELGRLLRTDRPVRHLCAAGVDEARAVLLLGRVDEPFQRRELELLRLCLPVIGLGDRRASEVQEALGARLTPREQEIFDFVSRGYNNREIAAVLGHLTLHRPQPALPALSQGGGERAVGAGGPRRAGHPPRAQRLRRKGTSGRLTALGPCSTT